VLLLVLLQYLGDLGANFLVFKNDEKTVDEIRALNPAGILVSPGPGVCSPHDGSSWCATQQQEQQQQAPQQCGVRNPAHMPARPGSSVRQLHRQRMAGAQRQHLAKQQHAAGVFF
jgi:hypothetical protein